MLQKQNKGLTRTILVLLFIFLRLQRYNMYYVCYVKDSTKYIS